MYQLVASFLAPVLLAALIFQSVRADGFLWWDGLSDQLRVCEDRNKAVEDATKVAADTAREEGRIAAEAASARLLEGAIKGREKSDADVAALRVLVSRLRPIAPPPIVIPGQPLPPVVVTPPALPRECRLDQPALDAIRATINAGRAP